MSTQEVADQLVALCRQGQNMQAVQNLYDKNVVSKEMPGWPQEVTSGLDNVIKKGEDWQASVNEFHASKISDPVVAGDHFTCKFSFDCTFKEQGRMQMEEIGMYQVKDGKIVQEQFFYQMPS